MSSDATRPERLRAACNSCHAAKTKCSGCKTGCDRCRSLGLPCKYEISMVGKVSGIRSRKRKTSQKADGDDVQCATCTNSVASPSAAAPDIPTPAPSTPWGLTTHFSGGLDATQSAAESALLSPWDVTGADTPTNALPMMIDPELEQWFDTGMESFGGMEELQETQAEPSALGHQTPAASGATPGSTLASILAGSQASVFANGATSNEAKNISVCSIILTTLITMLNDKAHTLDEVLSECRDQVLRLSAIIKDDEFEQWIGCRCLVSAALNLIICLFEKSILVEDEAGLGSGGGSGSRTFRFRYGLPRVSIGSLQYDDGDQFALCTYLMGEELTRTLSLLTQLRQTCAARASPGAASTAKVQEVWCEEFRARLQTLLSMLPSRRGDTVG